MQIDMYYFILNKSRKSLVRSIDRSITYMHVFSSTQVNAMKEESGLFQGISPRITEVVLCEMEAHIYWSLDDRFDIFSSFL